MEATKTEGELACRPKVLHRERLVSVQRRLNLSPRIGTADHTCHTRRMRVR
jgi:hypothetical protein